MKLYKVHYISDDDNTYNHWFSNKAEANKLQAKLSKLEKNGKELDSDFEFLDNNPDYIQCLFEINEYEVTISKKGIIDLLNNLD